MLFASRLEDLDKWTISGCGSPASEAQRAQEGRCLLKGGVHEDLCIDKDPEALSLRVPEAGRFNEAAQAWS